MQIFVFSLCSPCSLCEPLFFLFFSRIEHAKLKFGVPRALPESYLRRSLCRSLCSLCVLRALCANPCFSFEPCQLKSWRSQKDLPNQSLAFSRRSQRASSPYLPSVFSVLSVRTLVFSIFFSARTCQTKVWRSQSVPSKVP